MEDYQKMEQIVLEQLRFKMKKILGRHALMGMEVSVVRYMEDFSDHVAIEFQTKILGQKIPQKYTVQIDAPATWWEQFKYEHLPAWWQHRWPIKWKAISREIVLNHYALLPGWNKTIETDVVMHTQIPYSEPGVTLEE